MELGTVAGGAFTVLLPVLSKIFDAITNLIVGVIIDHTRTKQGKVRPWPGSGKMTDTPCSEKRMRPTAFPVRCPCR